MQALSGRFEHSLDDKNRVFAPARYRDQLSAENGRHFMLAIGLDRCLYLFLPSQWEHYLQKLEAAKFKSPQARRDYIREVFSNAAEASLDGEGRILIPQALRDYAGLRKDVVVTGWGTRAEIWDKASLAARQKASRKTYVRTSATLDL
jgi:MraZ protein